jgi:diaminopimelate decarboxylase
MPAVVQHMASLVDGLDVASAGELRCALDTPMPAGHICFAGPGKTDAELSQALAAGVIIHLESRGELRRLDRIAQASGITPQVALRVNPDFELRSSGMKMGGGAKPFGIDAEQAPALLQEIRTMGILCRGFHIFCGSQNLQPAALMEAHANSIALAQRLADTAALPVAMLNLGAGFGIPYFPGEQPLDILPIGEALDGALTDWRRNFPASRVALEMGRYLVGEAGIYVTRIIDRKISRGQVFLVTDGGMHHHLAASGNFGQVIRKNYPVAIGNKMQAEPREAATVVGPLCTPLDILASEMELACAGVGDLVVVFQSGAYGLTASPTGFLSHAAPLQVVV